MWTNEATQNNVLVLTERGIRVMMPSTGRLTGSDSGVGRLPEVEQIIEFALGGPLSGKRVVVTAGGTREKIDEVRYIGNSSTGRMGTEIAIAARDMGAAVTFIAANLETFPQGVNVLKVETVDDLEKAMDVDCDAIIMAAAVSDFRVKNTFAGKLSRSEVPNLQLEGTKDLIASYSARRPDVFAVAFALADENSDLETIGRQKLWDKGVDLVVANSTKTLGSKQAEVVLIDAESAAALAGSKAEVAKAIVSLVAEALSAR
jgi:phosphopantothenoylcysteine decarboxylase/phosphopantothenate--cysteine ligase